MVLSESSDKMASSISIALKCQLCFPIACFFGKAGRQSVDEVNGKEDLERWFIC